MKCDFCHKNPAIYLLEIKDEKGIRKYSLCGECLYEYIGRLFQIAFSQDKEEKRCPNCGRTWKKIEETGMVGCYYCYSVFKDELGEIIKNYHGNKKHKGKIPKNVSKKEDILKYKIELSKAIEEENYEKAAKLRDFLNKFNERSG
jgi:protein arginine kinase activator